MYTSRWIPLGMAVMVTTAALHTDAQQRPIAASPVQVKTAPISASQQTLPKAPLVNRESLAQIASAAKPPKGASRGNRKHITIIVSLVIAKKYDDALATWKDAVAAYTKGTRNADINALVQHVLRKTYLETNKDLQFYADKVRQATEKKKSAFAYRDELQKAQKQLKQGKTKTVRVSPPQLAKQGDPDRPVITGRVPKDVDVESVVPELAGIVVLCNHAEKESNDANLALQDAMNKQSQTYQTLSNVMKAFHDTAKAMIQNVR